MSWVLLGNDDGVDSPALLPFADALERALDLPVRVAVPDRERSWSGKAITRTTALRSRRLVRDGRTLVTVDGTPADAVQLGLFGLFAEEFAGAPPTVVVTGVNIGFNVGSGFVASSGTVWAAAEGAFAGLPAVAVSSGATRTDFAAWRDRVTGGGEEATAGWEAVAAVAADTVRAVGDSDLVDHCDVVSINVPWDPAPDVARAVTGLSPLHYGALFAPHEHEDDHHVVRQQLELRVDDPADGSVGDVRALRDGAVSVTPLVLPRSTTVPAHTRAALER